MSDELIERIDLDDDSLVNLRWVFHNIFMLSPLNNGDVVCLEKTESNDSFLYSFSFVSSYDSMARFVSSKDGSFLVFSRYVFSKLGLNFDDRLYIAYMSDGSIFISNDKDGVCDNGESLICGNDIRLTLSHGYHLDTKFYISKFKNYVILIPVNSHKWAFIKCKDGRYYISIDMYSEFVVNLDNGGRFINLRYSIVPLDKFEILKNVRS